MQFVLRTKLFALSTLIVTLIMSTVTWFLTVPLPRRRRVEVQQQISQVARNLANLRVAGAHDWDVYQNYLAILRHRDIVYVAIFDERNAIRAHALNSELLDLEGEQPFSSRAERDIVGRLDRGEVASENRDDLRTEVVDIQVGDRVLGSVHVGYSLLEVNRELAVGVRNNIVIAGAFVVLSAGLSMILSRRLTRPLERLSSAMRAIADGDLDQTVSIETHDEIAELGTTFNAMTRDLREREIADRLAAELRGTFRLERLGELVGDRLGTAIGASDARLFLRREGRKRVFVRLGAAGTDTHRTLELVPEVRALLRDRAVGLDLGQAPAPLRQALDGVVAAGHDPLVVPMLVNAEVLGLLLFDAPAGGRFDERQRRFATTLAGQAAFALENALLYEELREQERLRGELEVARAVQRRLLPHAPPSFPGFDIDGVCRPAHEVGGDYFDYMSLGDDRIGVVVADVSGKGASASLYMAELKGMMLSLATRERSPRTLLMELNRRLYPSLDRRVFVSMWYGILDRVSGRVTYARAGHSPLLHVRGQQSVWSAPSGIALGLDPGALFDRLLEEATIDTEVGDGLVMVTDGVIESIDEKGRPFGNDRLVAAVQAAVDGSAQSTQSAVLAAIDAHVGAAPRFDDLTLVVMRRTGPDGATGTDPVATE